MKLYNTLTRQVENLQPLNAPHVGIYTCGPTVYDYAHVGHWFTYVRADLLIRALKANGLEPEWVMNITDVGHLVSDADEGEDKLEKGARREGKTAWEVARFYEADFLKELALLNITKPNHITRATDHIAEQIALVKVLEDKGFTYIIDDGVYYDTSKFPAYGDFARLDLDELEAGKRVDFNPQKRRASDFALWKFSRSSSQRDMEWDSPWGKGFPGWHIECSAMAMKYLGSTLDIHTGGIDHIPVHHTNEIAQSEAATGQQFSKSWLHTNHVLVDGQKISKSLGNGVRLTELVEKGFEPQAFRLLVLESHYRSQSKFSLESLQAAANRLKDLKAMAVLRYQLLEKPQDDTSFSFADVADQIQTHLADDLNTPAIMAYLSDVSRQIQAVLLWHKAVPHFENMLTAIDDMLGLQLADVPDISAEQKELLQTRETARQAKDWPAADAARNKLLEQGIELRDTPSGLIWNWA
ncbi:MAG TPA: cysteine--tRNA ligase [Candidatus Saccharibacteria bacterium]|nr:cysteine--tRNA ligase [Candidatus Saccharibacteria bacterium]